MAGLFVDLSKNVRNILITRGFSSQRAVQNYPQLVNKSPVPETLSFISKLSNYMVMAETWCSETQ